MTPDPAALLLAALDELYRRVAALEAAVGVVPPEAPPAWTDGTDFSDGTGWA